MKLSTTPKNCTLKKHADKSSDFTIILADNFKN